MEASVWHDTWRIQGTPVELHSYLQNRAVGDAKIARRQLNIDGNAPAS